MFKKLLFLSVFILAGNCYATSYVVPPTQIKIYAQSQDGSTAHMIQSVNGIYNNGDHPWCGRRAYIDFADKALFSTALAASLSKQAIAFIYEDAAENKTIKGHAQSRCKVISIFEAG